MKRDRETDRESKRQNVRVRNRQGKKDSERENSISLCKAQTVKKYSCGAEGQNCSNRRGGTCRPACDSHGGGPVSGGGGCLTGPLLAPSLLSEGRASGPGLA